MVRLSYADVCGRLCWNVLLIHILSAKIEPIVNVYLCNFAFILAGSIFCSFTGSEVKREQVGWVLIAEMAGVVVFGFLTHFFIIKANSISKPSVVMPFGYVSVVVGFLGDVFLFGTEFSFLAVVGMLLTSTGLLGGYLISRQKAITESGSC